MRYILKHKDLPVFIFDMSGKNVVGAVINNKGIPHLPLPLKLIVNAGNIEEQDSDVLVVDEEGCAKIELWLSERAVPISRYNYEKYVEKNMTGIEWLLENNAFSFDDCYIVTEYGKDVSWKTVKSRMEKLDELISIEHNSSKINFRYKGHNSALGGQLEKYWFRQDGKLFLCKKNPDGRDILSIRELIAASIYKRLDFPACDYRLLRDPEGRITGCTCGSFIDNDREELVSAYDLLQEYGLTQNDNVYELLVKLAGLYGAEEEEVRRYLDVMTVVDYLITNRDRHEGNIGFIRDPDTLRIIKPVPVYDSGSSPVMEEVRPESVTETTVNGLYKTEAECLRHVRNVGIVNPDVLPSEEELGRILEESTSLSEERKDTLKALYSEKKAYLRLMQATPKNCPEAGKIDAENAMYLFKVLYKGLLKTVIRESEGKKLLVMMYNEFRTEADFYVRRAECFCEERKLPLNDIKDKSFRTLVLDAEKQLSDFLKEYRFDITMTWN